MVIPNPARVLTIPVEVTHLLGGVGEQSLDRPAQVLQMGAARAFLPARHLQALCSQIGELLANRLPQIGGVGTQ